MAMHRYAYASVVKPFLPVGGWDSVRVASKSSRLDRTFVDKASSILGSEFDPKDYLLTHATIVASVDTYIPKGVVIGKVMENGREINRPFPDFRVTSETEKYINNNDDFFERRVLLKSYKSFIGAHNFLEHCQQEELSKGRILDAVARDVGDSLYIDILVATNRKHKELIDAIQSGEMNAMSMGCKILGSICTKCGNFAVDETEMCPCIEFQKGNSFYDELGVKRKIAESCGHHSMGENGGVTYEEASWVGVAAFKGAALRGIVNVVDGVITLEGRKTASEFKIPESLPERHLLDEGLSKAASLKKKSWDEGETTEPEAPSAPEAPAKESKDRIKELEDGLYDDVVERVRKRVREDLTPKPDVNPESSDAPNDTVIKQASPRTMSSYKRSVASLVKAATSDKQLIESLRTLNESYGLKMNPNVYRVAFLVGPHKDYDSVGQLKRVASAHHKLSGSEMNAVMRLSRILSFRR